MKLRLLVNHFLKGLLLVVPLSATTYVIYVTIRWVDGLIPINIPGVGLVTVVVATTLLGMIANSFVARHVFGFVEGLLKKIPVVNFIYSSFHDVIGAVAGEKKKFNRPVLVPFDDKGILLKPGFVTQDDLSDSNLEEYIAVYLPHSYNFSGNLFFVEKSKIIPLT
ncbi:MAG: DUF502 domain-containing protein, partial [Cyclobacteriaceae bacterium]|nr:DUF502 domain-containing protein [Cyclobacteriaceae bacterium]